MSQVAAVLCSGTGPSQLGEAARAVWHRVQQHETVTALEPASDALPIALEWNQVRIEQLLGSGSFSVVYQAKIKALHTPLSHMPDTCYALKKLSTETICCNESFVTGAIDLALEATILSRLRHDHVIRMYGVKGGSIAESFATSSNNMAGGGGFFLVMQCLTESLNQRLDNWRQADVKESGLKKVLLTSRKSRAVKRLQGIADRLETVIMGVVKGMEYIHSKHIILRDLKPHNIGFDKDGKVRIFDFGLARELVSSGHGTLIPRMNTGIAGTLRYISPENAVGQPCSLSVDVYSFAILLYEVITLQVPFCDIKLVQHFKEKVIRGRHRPNLKFVPSSIIQDLLRDSWDPNPHKRPTFAEIRCILEEILQEGILTKEGEWKNVVFTKPKFLSSSTAASCAAGSVAMGGASIMDRSVGGGSVQRLSCDTHPKPIGGIVKKKHSQSTETQVVVDLKSLQDDDQHHDHHNHQQDDHRHRRAGMSGSYNCSLNNEQRSFNENISFNSSYQRQQVTAQ